MKQLVGYVVREGTLRGQGRYAGPCCQPYTVHSDWKCSQRSAYVWPSGAVKDAIRYVFAKPFYGRVVKPVRNVT